jgi:hypothetical protein
MFMAELTMKDVGGLPIIKELPCELEWEEIELLMTRHNNRNVPRFEE